jgi:hypothetical protein
MESVSRGVLTLRSAVALILSVSLLGCGGAGRKLERVEGGPPGERAEVPSGPVSGGGSPAKPQPAAPDPEAPAEPGSAADAGAWARASLLTEAPRAGGRVEFLYEFTNRGGQPLNLTFRSGQTVEMVIEREGAEVWRHSRSAIFTQALLEVSLGAGESKAWRITWDGRDEQGRPVHPGRYEARLHLTAGGTARSEVTVAFTVSHAGGQ